MGQQLFTPETNSIAKAIVFALLSCGVLTLILLTLFVHSDYSSGVGLNVDQPIQFSHAHHVGALGLDCRFCHTQVESSASAGIPDLETCMGCHSHIWKTAPILKPLRDAYDHKTPLAWTKVHQLPNHVYFEHSIHIAKGVACADCHGPVEKMPLIRKVRSFTMKDCLECHRAHEAGAHKSLTDCTVCHR